MGALRFKPQLARPRLKRPGLLTRRFGQWVELVVDEGDGPLYNTTPTPDTLGGWSVPLQLDRQEGVLVGGSPEYVGVSLFTVHHDFHEGEWRGCDSLTRDVEGADILSFAGHL